MDEAKIKEVLSDEAFVKELLELETPAEVQAALKAKGIEMTESEIIELRDNFIEAAEKIGESGELSADQLDEAAGGFVVFGGSVTLLGAGAVAVAGTATVGAGIIVTAGTAMAGAMAVAGAGALGVAAGIGAIGSAISSRRW